MAFYQFKHGQSVGLLKASSLAEALKRLNSQEERQTLRQVQDFKLFKACSILLLNDDIIFFKENTFFNLNMEAIKWET